jgi:hypothetical protein
MIYVPQVSSACPFIVGGDDVPDSEVLYNDLQDRMPTDLGLTGDILEVCIPLLLYFFLLTQSQQLQTATSISSPSTSVVDLPVCLTIAGAVTSVDEDLNVFTIIIKTGTTSHPLLHLKIRAIMHLKSSCLPQRCCLPGLHSIVSITVEIFSIV